MKLLNCLIDLNGSMMDLTKLKDFIEFFFFFFDNNMCSGNRLFYQNPSKKNVPSKFTIFLYIRESFDYYSSFSNNHINDTITFDESIVHRYFLFLITLNKRFIIYDDLLA